MSGWKDPVAERIDNLRNHLNQRLSTIELRLRTLEEKVAGLEGSKQTSNPATEPYDKARETGMGPPPPPGWKKETPL